MKNDSCGDLNRDVLRELATAMARFKPFNSAHEGFAVLLEEVDELKAEVWKNQKRRDYTAMRKECVQVAAMAMRLALEICEAENAGHEMRQP